MRLVKSNVFDADDFFIFLKGNNLINQQNWVAVRDTFKNFFDVDDGLSHVFINSD